MEAVVTAAAIARVQAFAFWFGLVSCWLGRTGWMLSLACVCSLLATWHVLAVIAPAPTDEPDDADAESIIARLRALLPWAAAILAANLIARVVLLGSDA